MTTQTAERQELQRVIDTLPDDRVPAVLDFAKIYCPYAPNARRKSDLLLSPTMNTKGWRFSREEANE